MKLSIGLCFLHVFITLVCLGTNRSTGLLKHHVKQLRNQVIGFGKIHPSDGALHKTWNNLNHGAKKKKILKIDIEKNRKTSQNKRHLQTNNGGNKISCEGNSCTWSTTNIFNPIKIKRSLVNEVTRNRRRESVFLAKALDMLDHARPRELGSLATRATSNKPFKSITTATNTSKEKVDNATLVNKPLKFQSGDKRQQWSDESSEMRPRFFFNSAPAEYVEQKPPSLSRTEHGPIHLALPPVARGRPHGPGHLQRTTAFFKGPHNDIHLAKHPAHFPPFPLTLVGNPLTHHISASPHFHNHPHQHHFGPPPYAIHIHAPPRLEPPPPPLPDMPPIPPDVFREPMTPLNSPIGVEPRPPNVHMVPPPDLPFLTPPPINLPDGAVPPESHMIPPEGIPLGPPPINIEGNTPPEDLLPMPQPHPPLGMETPPPDVHMIPPPEIPFHAEHPMNAPIGTVTDLNMMPAERVPMSPPTTDLQGIPPAGVVAPMSPPHAVQRIPVPVPVPVASPPKVEHVPYPVPVPGPPSIQPVMVPVKVQSPPKIQQVAVPVQSPPQIHNVPVPFPVAVPSPPEVKHIPYPVAYPVKAPGEIQKIFYPIAVPQPSQIHHVPFPVYIRYPPEIRRVPYAVPSPPKPYPVPVPSPPHLVIHRVPYPVMFSQRVPYPIPVVVQHHHIHEDLSNGGESISNGQCLVNLCLNGGTCSAYMNSYRCHCPSGFQGKHCEEQNMCTPNPCKNFGTCSQVEHDYECTCSKGFIGKNCDRQDPCLPSPCQNGASCSSDGSSYSCTCKIGWMGRNCQVESKCLPINPCQNGGTCTEAQGSYQCDCSPGWSGLSCEVTAPETLHQTVLCDNCHNSDHFLDQRNKLRHRLSNIKKWKVAKG